MAYLNYRKQKNGTTYVYEVESYWDKDLKKPRNLQKYIGKLDEKTGEVIPSKKLDPGRAALADPAVTATTTVTGPSLILEKITEDSCLKHVLKKAFPDHWEAVLSLVWYIACRGEALCHADSWLRNHTTYLPGGLSSQRISELLGKITDDSIQTFFKIWSNKIKEKDYLCYDITSVSSYSEQNEYVRYGYNRDGEHLKQINLGMVYGQKSHLPVTYRRIPGSVSDVSTLNNLLKNFDKLDFPKLHLVMDRGFYSEANVDTLLEQGEKFILGVPIHRKWVKEIIDRNRDVMYGPHGYRKIDGEVLYVHSHMMSWGEKRKRCYLQLYFNNHQAADAHDGFIDELLTYREELESSKRIAEHEDAYQQYFIMKETPKRGLQVKYNDEAIAAHRNQYSGFSAILSNDIKDPVETLLVYRDKDVVEKCFDNLKNTLDMKRLRMHTSKAMDSRIFLQFMALIYISQIQRILREHDLLGKYTTRSVLNEMESLTAIRFSGKYGQMQSEITKAQREILTAFDIQLKA
jgi:transposase